MYVGCEIKKTEEDEEDQLTILDKSQNVRIGASGD